MDNNELEHIVDGIMYKINSYNFYVEIYLSNGDINSLCKKFNTYDGDICSVFDSVDGILSYL